MRRHHDRFTELAPNVVLRDQRMSDRALARCLPPGVDPDDWRATINDRVFLWADRAALLRLLRANPERAQAVLMLDTARLLEAHGTRVETSPINSGACAPAYASRGAGTFLPASCFPRPDGRPVREVTVLGAINPVIPFMIEVLEGDRLAAWFTQPANRAKSRASTS
jgi:hypothetical protein